MPVGHKEECLCISGKNGHKCDKDCSLKSKSRKGCSGLCEFIVDHKGFCFCKNLKNSHICNKECKLKKDSFKDSCNQYCIYETGHEGNHLCDSLRHECNEPCKYKHFSREGCLGHCSNEVGHKSLFNFFFPEEHQCSNSKIIHICKEECILKNKSRSGCYGICDKHIKHDGDHLCNSQKHLCKEKCQHFGKCPKGCLELCTKKAGHNDTHDCNSDEHFCSKKCNLLNISRGCSSNCSLYNGHSGKCICKISENKHLCDKLCVLCKEYCCYEFNHEGIHLCDKEHECKEFCNEPGICEIKTTTNIDVKKSTKIYIVKGSNQRIEYIENNEQTNERKKCVLKIPKGKISHEKHKCEQIKHKCGEKCKQCNRLCELEINHNSAHYCKHGQIKNSKIQTEEKMIKINFKDKLYDFGDDEDAIIFTCYEYCKEQKRGHVHRIYENQIINLEESLSNGYIRKKKGNIYECKCHYFWKNILEFRFETEFDNELITQFNKCPAKCGFCDEEDNLTYCDLNLWHLGRCEFSCKHGCPKPCHTIFIIDKSDSMGSEDIKPEYEKIRKNNDFNNRLGCVLHVVDNYIKKRLNINKEDVFSFITFSSYSEIIFRDYDYNKITFTDLVDYCIDKIGYPIGNTFFLEGFKKANIILLSIDKIKYKPVIILLSDGENYKASQNETIKYIKRVSIINLLLILLI